MKTPHVTSWRPDGGCCGVGVVEAEGHETMTKHARTGNRSEWKSILFEENF